MNLVSGQFINDVTPKGGKAFWDTGVLSTRHKCVAEWGVGVVDFKICVTSFKNCSLVVLKNSINHP